MCEKYSRSLLRISVAQICQNLGWNSAQSSSLEVLTDVLEKYILKIGGTCRKFSEQYGHDKANLNDLGLAFQQLGISIPELEDYVHHVEPVPFAHEVVAFPASKTSNLGFPNPRSREILQHREEHIPDYMPYMFPNMKDEIPEDKISSPLNVAETPLKSELSQENGDKEDVNVGDKRTTTMSTPELPASKRPRFGNSNLPEEAGHSQYEMTCVFMGPNGVLTTRQGCQGRLPEPRMPPPNPRTLNEGANKENSGKAKDSTTGSKVPPGVGGIGADSLTSGKNESKKSRKSPQKRKMVHGQAAKLSSDDVVKKPFKSSLDGIGRELGKKSSSKTLLDGTGKEIGKKSVSSKAAAKFLKKLKLSKKSSKLFTKSKAKDQKLSEFQKDGSFPEKAKKLVIQTNVEEGKKRKERKIAEVVDSDEELRNLVSPSSSRVPSPDQPITTDAEGGAKMKARLEAINDSINSVLREGPSKGGKIKKRRKKEEKSEETTVSGDSTVKGQSDGKPPEPPKVKRKPGRPPKIQKPPEPPPPVDVKPFVSDKYSSEELQVYEFNDSPPDTSISSRRPSAAETVTPVAPSLPPPPPQPTVKHEPAVPTTKHVSAPSLSSHKFHRKVEPEDDLFAPEIKIESRIDHSDSQSVRPFKLEFSKDKEKQKVKEEKKQRVEEEKVSHKRVEEEKVSHKRVEEEKVSHKRVEEEKVSQKRAEEEKVSHKRVEEEKVSHKRVEEEKMSHKRAEEEKVSHKRVEEEKVSHKSKDEKGDRRKDKKEKHKDDKDRPRDDKEKHKEKVHRKDKKDKKKEKEKKRRHKFKDHERDKEKDKKQEEKVKQESRESRESSPTVGVGVKLKIKIGGSAGTPTSMMVTGEGSSPASPAPTLGSKRESMSPPRVVPKLYISKKGPEEKSKKVNKPRQRGNDSKHKLSPLAVSVKCQPASPSSSKASPSPRSTPTPPVPRKTPTPPPNAKSTKSLPSPHGKNSSNKQKDSTSLVPAKERPSRSPIKERAIKSDRKKKERKPSLSSLSSMSSSPSPSPAKSPIPRRQSPPRLQRMSSSSPEKSPPSLPFQSPTPSPRTSSSAARSPSRASSPHHSPTPPPSLSRRKPTPPPALSPSHSPSRQSHSPPPTRPPTPGSTSPPPSPDWALPVSSPSHPRSPTPTPRTPTASPLRNAPSPAHSFQPGSPVGSHRSPSPAVHSSSRPGSRLETPEPRSQSKDNPSPASSGKSSASGFKPSRTVEAETVCVFYDDSGQKVWICPACKLPDDGSEMIGCDMCDNWYHWPCVGINEAPPEEQQWFCCKCLPKTKSSVRGRGRPRGRGRGRGRKKIT